MEQQELMERLAAAYDTLSTAEKATEDAHREVARLEALAPTNMASEMESVRYPNEAGAFEVKFKNSWATEFMARAYGAILNGIGAKNYVEVSYVLEDKPLIVTIVHPDGERPSVLVGRLTRENEALKAAARRVLKATEDVLDAHNDERDGREMRPMYLVLNETTEALDALVNP